MNIFAIDPGSTQSAWLVLANGGIAQFGIERNENLLDTLKRTRNVHFACEYIGAIYGRAQPEHVETARWTGRFEQRLEDVGSVLELVHRKTIAACVCGSSQAGDRDVRHALIRRFGDPGTKKSPGPTYGLKADLWAALAVAVTVNDGCTSFEGRGRKNP